MRQRDFEVIIECDGQPLDEYAVSIDGNSIESFVVSEPGKVFTIVCNNYSHQHFVVQSTVDGRRFPRNMLIKGDQLKSRPVVEDGIGGARPLLFSSIAVTDDEEAAKDLACEGQLGEIQTRIVRVEPGEPIEWTPSTVNETQNFGVIHESVKKVGMHCVSFGATVPIPRRKVYNVVYIDKVSSPYITFTFRYRPRAILQAEGIIEPDPIPDRQPTRSPRSPTEPLPPRETRSPTARGESLEAEHLREQPDEPSPSTRPKKRRRRGRPSSTSAESPDGDASPVAKPEDEATPSVKEEDDVEDVDALEAQLSAIRQRIDRARANQTGRSGSRVIKRESSPIRVGRFHGGIIDLTDD